MQYTHNDNARFIFPQQLVQTAKLYFRADYNYGGIDNLSNQFVERRVINIEGKKCDSAILQGS